MPTPPPLLGAVKRAQIHTVSHMGGGVPESTMGLTVFEHFESPVLAFCYLPSCLFIYLFIVGASSYHLQIKSMQTVNELIGNTVSRIICKTKKTTLNNFPEETNCTKMDGKVHDSEEAMLGTEPCVRKSVNVNYYTHNSSNQISEL